jgi:Undecaprenyl-phosphate glucose phosphotransferase
MGEMERQVEAEPRRVAPVRPLPAGQGNVASFHAPAGAGADAVPPTGGSVLIPFTARRLPDAGSSTLSPAWRVVLRSVEIAVIMVSGLLADVGYHELVLGGGALSTPFWAAGLMAGVLYACLMQARESGQPLRSVNSAEALRDVALFWFSAVGGVTFFAFALKATDVISRGALLGLLVLGLVGLVATRQLLPHVVARLRGARRATGEQVIVIGMRGDPMLDTLLEELRLAGIGTSGVVRIPARQAGRTWRVEFSAAMPAIIDLTRQAPYGDICIAGGGFAEDELHDLLVGLQVVPRAVRVVPSASVERALHFPVRSVGRLLSVEQQKAPMGPLQLVVKRAMDVVLAGLGLVVLLPLLLLAGLAIGIETKGRILFRQDRLGHRGVPFSIFKFRTMTVAENGPVVRQASAHDKRVTRVGRWLRRLSIDELPQLLNVLRGEMSLVGPRPHAVAHDRLYAELIDNYEIRQHVKPGLTGWAQANGLRGETADPELMRRRVEHDIWYAKNASVMLDIRILCMTVIEVFRQRNAH